MTKNDFPDVPSERELVITRIFDAPRRLVFEAWTKPEHLERWQGAPGGFNVTTHEVDFRPGGAYRLCMRSPEGIDHWLQGVYREIAEPERLVFTHIWLNAEGKPGKETLVTITFTERGGKTELTLHQTGFKSMESRDGHEKGWTSTFDRFAEYLAKVPEKKSSALTGRFPSDREVEFTRVFDAPRRLVFEAWTNPAHLPHWMLGPPGWTMPVCEIDLRPGGEWHFVWHHADGTEMEMRGVYKEIVPPERLVSTECWGGNWPETLNTLMLSEKDGKTTMTLRILYPSKEARDGALQTGMKEGMSLSFNRLGEYLHSL